MKTYGFNINDEVIYKPFTGCSKVDVVENVTITEIISDGFFKMTVKNKYGDIITTNFRATYNTLSHKKPS